MARRPQAALRRPLVAAALSVCACPPAAHAGFTPPDWTSAKLRIDTAELVAKRNIGAVEVNTARLIDANVVGVPDADLSDDMFGALNAAPAINQGAGQTGIREVDIPQYFWPALAAGTITLDLLLTDTSDATFALDFVSILIVPNGGAPFEKLYGAHPTCQNNGFGLGIADGANLPANLPGALAPTGTGFDEAISSKHIVATFTVPAPGAAAIAALGLSCILAPRRRAAQGAQS